MKKRTISFIFLANFISFPTHAESQENSYGYYPEKVSLAGVVSREMFYGVPNFGETPDTDEKVYALILKLDEPISVHGDNGADYQRRDSFDNISEIELRSEKDETLIGKHVLVTGELYERTTSFDHTDVLLRREKITELPSKSPMQ